MSKVEAITGYMDNANSSWNSLKDLTRVELTKIYDKEQQDKSAQNNEPAPTKQPETKTEPRRKIDFSEASVKLEDALNKWEAIKKGDIVVTKSGRALIAQSDAKGKMSIRFKVREGSLEEALSVLNVTGNNKVSKMLSDRLQEQSKNELVKKLIGKTPEGKDLYEDGRGVRFTDNGRGVQVGEDVAITMQNGKTVYDVSGRTDEHRTVEEVAARQPKPKKLQYGDEGYTSDMANQDLSELYLQKEKNGMVEDDRLNQRIKNLEKIFYELRANEPLGRKTSEEKPTPKQQSNNSEPVEGKDVLGVDFNNGWVKRMVPSPPKRRPDICYRARSDCRLES
ncbi:MAG: hypothetical protein IPL13_18875 [Saprospiraceae bacterium]|nr:hypothetical protein [Candidatus Brachybacter algidus]